MVKIRQRKSKITFKILILPLLKQSTLKPLLVASVCFSIIFIIYIESRISLRNRRSLVKFLFSHEVHEYEVKSHELNANFRVNNNFLKSFKATVQGTWLKDPNHKQYNCYSAHFDDRIGEIYFIRIIALVNKLFFAQDWYCQHWFENLSTSFENKTWIIVSKVHSVTSLRHSLTQSTVKQDLTEIIISCPLPIKDVSPTHVALTTNASHLNPYIVPVTKKDIPKLTKNNLPSFVLCTLLTLSDYEDLDKLDVIEWVEMHYILGVSKIFIYLDPGHINSNLKQALDWYTKQDTRKLVEVHLIETVGGHVNLTLIAVNDCMYRSMSYNRTGTAGTRILFMNIDEVLVPQPPLHNYAALQKYMTKNLADEYRLSVPALGQHPVSYVFLMTNFYEIEEKQALIDMNREPWMERQLASRVLRMLRRRLRRSDAALYKSLGRSGHTDWSNQRAMTDSGQCLMHGTVSCEYPLVDNLRRPTSRSTAMTVPINLALVHRYPHCMPNILGVKTSRPCEEDSGQLVKSGLTDNSTLRFEIALNEFVNRVLSDGTEEK